jgi:oxygen-independent coproporphyrinogen-3 oxidase
VTQTRSNRTIPLSLYIHIPWCVQKCPYCDFNSHQLKGNIPEKEYIAHLLDDLQQDIPLVTHNSEVREVSTIFIGGGTPSLLSVEGMQTLLDGVRKRIPIAANAEISMEANPGTVEAERFKGYAQAGVNRISIGVQSFQAEHLSILGRIHDSQQAHRAIELAQSLGLKSFNTDLMHGLPQQSIDNALSDLNKAIAHNPPHLSWYQLTIEPNTLFYSKPPELPNDDLLWDIQEQGQQILEANGYIQYEISAYAKKGHQCRHNLNYWRFGDYLGIGCGAHAKITDLNTHSIKRSNKVKHPKGYMDISKSYVNELITISDEDLAFEFFMNRFRLMEACHKTEFARHTGRELYKSEQAVLHKATDKGLIIDSANTWQLSQLGKRYLNTLLADFV